MDYKEVISSIGFQEFLDAARGYCNLLESERTNNYLLDLQKALLAIYSHGMNLPSIGLISNVDFNEKLDRTEFDEVKNRTSESLGEIQVYWTIFDPTENVFGNEKPVMGDLLDDIMDIYKDIKRQLITFDLNTNDSIENAVWGMRFDFWNHWSHHAIDAIRTIHYVIEKERV